MKMLAKKLSLSRMASSCDEVSSLLRSLSHPQRLMILGHLTQGEKTVSELQDLCEISQSQLSQFLVRMKLEGIVGCVRKGRNCYYSMADKRVSKLVESIHNIFCR
jgi:DNA-binding HxlR family transcriptional regulator